MKSYKYIEINKDKCFGMPSVVGRRLTVCDVVSSMSIDEKGHYNCDYELSAEEIKETVLYCKNRICDNEAIQYCDGCILRSIADGESSSGLDFETIDSNTGLKVSSQGNVYTFSSKEEFEDNQFGQMRWLYAEELANRLGW